MTKREKVLAWIVGGAVVVLLNIFILDFFFTNYGKLRQDLARKQAQLNGMKTLLAAGGAWEQREAWLTSKQPKLENEATAGVQLLNQVQELAKKNTVLVEQPALGNLERRPHYSAVVVNLETKSTWKSLIGFLAALQGPDLFIVVEKANLKIDVSDPTQMRCQLRIAKWYAPK